MRIFFLIRDMTIGGAQRQLVLLASELRKQGHQVTVATFYPGGQLWNELTENSVEAICLDKKGRWDIFLFLFRLIKEIRRNNPDILYAYLRMPNILSIIAKLIFPEMRVVWSVRSSNTDFSQYNWLTRLSFWLECRLAQFADLIISNSDAGKRFVAENGFPENKVQVVYNGIDTERFKPAPELRQRIRTEWGIAPDCVLIGMVARLDPKKDHDTFLRAARVVADRTSMVKFVCVGSGPKSYEQYLRATSHALGLQESVVWAGTRQDMAAVYGAINILCLPSSSGEGFPNAVGEAMACGVPCVVTDNGDSAFVVGDTGAVVPVGDADAIADAVLGLMAVRSDAMRHACRMRVQRYFSPAALTDATLLALRGLTDGAQYIDDGKCRRAGN